MSLERLPEYGRYLKQGLYELDECLVIIECIGHNSAKINKTQFANSLGRIQSQLISYLILLIAKFFDRSSEPYLTVSIISTLKILKENKNNIKINSTCKYKLRELGIGSLDNNDLDQSKVIEFITNYFDNQICSNSEIIRKIRDRRNKLIAHNEAKDPSTFEDLNWKEINVLIDLVRKFIDVLNPCVFNKAAVFTDLPSVKESMSQLIDLLVES